MGNPSVVDTSSADPEEVLMSFTDARTPRWTSPEVLRDPHSRRTKQSDCYSLGMVIYEVCENGTVSLFLVVYFSTLGPLWGGSFFGHQ